MTNGSVIARCQKCGSARDLRQRRASGGILCAACDSALEHMVAHVEREAERLQRERGAYQTCPRCRRPGRLVRDDRGALACEVCTPAPRGAVVAARGRGAGARQLDAFAGRDARGVAPQLDLFGLTGGGTRGTQ